MTTQLARHPTLVVGVVVGVVMAGANLAGGRSLAQAILAGSLPAIYALIVTILARRSELASVLAGTPVDERFEHINMEASTIAFGATAIVALAAFLAAQATGGDWLPWALLCAVMALSYIGALVVLRARG